MDGASRQLPLPFRSRRSAPDESVSAASPQAETFVGPPRPISARRVKAEAVLVEARRRTLRAYERVRGPVRRRPVAEEKRFRYRTLRDVLGALVIVGVVLGLTSLATDGAWPPVLVIESGSMMHSSFDSPYGRIGSVDVGDLVFVRAADEPMKDVDLWVDGGKDHYKRPGDVMVFYPNGNRTETSVVHRAMTYVEVVRLPGGGTNYQFKWLDGEILTFGPRGIYFPPLGFDENFGFSPNNGYRPPHSGFLTKGDNAYSNPAVDQALRISAPVDPTWVEGTVHGEIPWIGLGRLALQNGQTNPAVPGWERIGNAFAPIELWTMFFLVLAFVILVPLSIDTHRMWRRERERRRQRRLERRDTEERKPVEFQPVSRRS